MLQLKVNPECEMNSMTIGQVAQKAGIGIETIRFYERKGLIEEPPRKESGYRQYGVGVVDQLAFIQQAKELGFSLKEIGELLSIKADTKTVCKDVKQVALEKLQDIESKIKLLQRMRKALRKLVDKCPGQGPLSECPILDALDNKTGK
jgi:MerR family mercuric resistance operon transcriptional regulator